MLFEKFGSKEEFRISIWAATKFLAFIGTHTLLKQCTKDSKKVVETSLIPKITCKEEYGDG